MKQSKYISILIVFAVFFTACTNLGANRKNYVQEDLGLARERFKTNLIKTSSAPQQFEDEIPPDGVSEVTFQSGELEMKAWLSNPAESGKKYPAVVYIHGGFAFSDEDWEYVKPYIDNGFIVLAPTLRGENGNPGNFEFFYGEVDDVIAAGEYLTELSYIDKDRIFVSGHSTGGTLTVLASLMESPFKSAVSFGASVDQKNFFKEWREYAPFNVNDPKEISLRSPIDFVESLKIPLTLYVGSDDEAYKDLSENFASKAKEYGKACECIVVEGNHFTSLEESIRDSIEKFSN